MKILLLTLYLLTTGVFGLTAPAYGQASEDTQDEVEDGDQFQLPGKPESKVTVNVTGLTTGNKRVKITNGQGNSGQTDNAHGTAGVRKSGDISVDTDIEDEDGEPAKKTDKYRVRPGGNLEHQNADGTWTKMVPVPKPKPAP